MLCYVMLSLYVNVWDFIFVQYVTFSLCIMKCNAAIVSYPTQLCYCMSMHAIILTTEFCGNCPQTQLKYLPVSIEMHPRVTNPNLH